MAFTVVIVAYGVDSLSLDWVPDTTEVIVVHNDDALRGDGCVHPNVVHVRPGRNVGFGAGVNLGLARVTTERVILCNPDTLLERAHFDALDGDDDAIVAIPLVEADGTPNAVVNPYWMSRPSSPRSSDWSIRAADRAPPGATRIQRGSSCAPAQAGVVPAGTGSWRAALGANRALRAVGGFDERYFLYYEDADLQQRLSNALDEGGAA